MLNRASKKLGLDQAIFGTGQFNQSSATNEITVNKERKKEEIEELLKKGAYACLENDTETKAFMEDDINDILEKKTRTVK